jgi:hypothetical protein
MLHALFTKGITLKDVDALEFLTGLFQWFPDAQLRVVENSEFWLIAFCNAIRAIGNSCIYFWTTRRVSQG